MLQLKSVHFDLPERNVFNLRDYDWSDRIVNDTAEILKAGEQYGITVKSISIEQPVEKDSKLEIKKTLSKMLNITLVYGKEKELNLSYEIPWLINNHFYIGGNRKIGIYQLFDKPVIKRKNIKIRTNIHTLVLYRKTSGRFDYNYYLSYASKEIPLAYYLLAFKGVDRVKEEFGISEEGMIENSSEAESEEYFDLLTDLCKAIQTKNSDSYLSIYFNRRDDSDIINDLLLLTQVDIFSSRYLTKDNVLDEFVHVIENGTVDELDYMNKRVRFAEQLIFYHLCKDFYNMINTIRRSKRSRFKANSKSILSSANRSSIVQYDFSLNPLGELAMLSRISLTGPGGFEKDNVPAYLRDIHPSIKGMICPSDTGDRENCGTTQYLVPTIRLKDDLSFYKGDEKNVTSIAISHVPFMEHNDATRLQMASSQQRHAVMLSDFDIPLIQSGVEGLYTDQTSFMFRAERDGRIVFKDDNIIIAQYDNKECKAFNIGYKKLFLSICDLYNTYFDVDEEFKAGDIIAESNYLTDGRLNVGKNLKTAVMIYYGYNYEDGIVISDKLVKDDSMTSVHYLDLSYEVPPNKVLLNLNDNYKDYKPIPMPGDRFKKGDVYAKIKTISGYGDRKEVIFDEAHEKAVTEDCIVADVKVYANKWNKDFDQYDHFINEFIEKKRKSKKKLVETLSEYLTKDELENFLESLEVDRTEKSRGHYRIKGDSIDGLRVEITAIYKRPITIGDKIGNRHGNKGVISTIVPEELMPKFSDGSRAEVIINPLGIVSRMNIGQLFELHMSKCVEDFKKQTLEMINQEEKVVSSEDIRNRILEFVKLIDCTEGQYYTCQVEAQVKNANLEELQEIIENFYIIQPPFESVKIEHLKEAMKFTNTRFEYECYDPKLDEKLEEHAADPDYFDANIKNKIGYGSMYFVKMNHIAKDKIASRSVGPYTSKTAQPIDGKARKGGQRLGEMEVWAVAGHGASHNLQECLTTKSDSIKKRNQYISHMVNNDDILLEEDDSVSQAVRLFQNMLRCIGLDYPVNEEEDENG